MIFYIVSRLFKNNVIDSDNQYMECKKKTAGSVNLSGCDEVIIFIR